MIFSDGERHRETRTFASKFFSKHGLRSLTRKRVTNAEDGMREQLSNCVKDYIKGKRNYN